MKRLIDNRKGTHPLKVFLTAELGAVIENAVLFVVKALFYSMKEPSNVDRYLPDITISNCLDV